MSLAPDELTGQDSSHGERLRHQAMTSQKPRGFNQCVGCFDMLPRRGFAMLYLHAWPHPHRTHHTTPHTNPPGGASGSG